MKPTVHDEFIKPSVLAIPRASELTGDACPTSLAGVKELANRCVDEWHRYILTKQVLLLDNKDNNETAQES